MDEADNLCNRIAIVDHGKMAALDTPTKLKDSVSERWRRGRSGIFDHRAADWPDALKALPGVTGVSEHDGVAHISSKSGPDTIGALMDLARQRNVKVHRVTVKTTTLDDVFLHYTGRQLRDEAGGGKRLDVSHLYK